jgi:SpoVK/Ycf46/Vps4 family AAA+-type ATPase
VRESLRVPHATSQHLEIQAPDEAGRHEILGIHLRSLRSSDRLSACASAAVAALAQDKTQGWSGAELAGLVRSATSFALQRALDELEASSPAAAAAASAGAAEAEASGGGAGARGRGTREGSGRSAVSRGELLQVQVCAEDLFRAHAEIDEARSLVCLRERVCSVWFAFTPPPTRTYLAEALLPTLPLSASAFFMLSPGRGGGGLFGRRSRAG